MKIDNTSLQLLDEVSRKRKDATELGAVLRRLAAHMRPTDPAAADCVVYAAKNLTLTPLLVEYGRRQLWTEITRAARTELATYATRLVCNAKTPSPPLEAAIRRVFAGLQLQPVRWRCRQTQAAAPIAPEDPGSPTQP